VLQWDQYSDGDYLQIVTVQIRTREVLAGYNKKVSQEKGNKDRSSADFEGERGGKVLKVRGGCGG
jgi:hypothetical protein